MTNPALMDTNQAAVPADDTDQMQKHMELDAALRRAIRRERYPEYWDYRNPRSAAEYIENNQRRRRNKERRFGTFVQRFAFVATTLFVWALLLALLVG